MITDAIHRTEASLLEQWTVSRTMHWARTSGAFGGSRTADEPAARAGRTGSAIPAAAQTSRTEHLLRLASDTRATPYERALAAERAADILRRTA